MALIECPECGHSVSDQAAACPNCGHPLRVETPPPPPAPAPTEPEEGAPATKANPQRGYGIALAVGGGLIAVGSFMPWRTLSAPLLGTVNIAGTEGDGIITLGLGAFLVLIGVIGAARGIGRIGGITGLVVTAFATWVWWTGLSNTLDVIDDINRDLDTGAIASVGIGLWIMAVGLVVSFVGSGGMTGNPVD